MGCGPLGDVDLEYIHILEGVPVEQLPSEQCGEVCRSGEIDA